MFPKQIELLYLQNKGNWLQTSFRDKNLIHYEVGQKVRKTINEVGGDMPEDLPIADGVGRARRRIKKSKKKELVSGSRLIIERSLFGGYLEVSWMRLLLWRWGGRMKIS